MSKELLIDLLPLGVNLIVWGSIILYSHRKHKKRMKEIEEKWAERRRQWQAMDITDEVNRYLQTGRRSVSVWVPYDEVRPKTDKLSPKKKMGKHKMR